MIQGQVVTIDHFQSGARGRGRIKIEAEEIERLKGLMRVRPQPIRPRHLPTSPQHFPGITVKLGRPDNV